MLFCLFTKCLEKLNINFKVQAYEKVIDGFKLTLCHRPDHIHLYAWLTVPLKDDSQVVRRGSGATPQGHQVSNLMALRLQFLENYERTFAFSVLCFS